ncbi:MAG: hypothetical protein ACLTGK_03965, partial [Eubacterium sp.]
MKDRRNTVDKLKTLLFGKDLRITKGDAYPSVYDYDFSSYYPQEEYIKLQRVPSDNVYDIRDFGADCNSDDNADAINSAVKAANETGGTVLVSGGDYVTTTVFLLSNVTLFIEYGSSLSSNKSGVGYNHLGILHCDGGENITLTGGGKV